MIEWPTGVVPVLARSKKEGAREGANLMLEFTQACVATVRMGGHTFTVVVGQGPGHVPCEPGAVQLAFDVIRALANK